MNTISVILLNATLNLLSYHSRIFFAVTDNKSNEIVDKNLLSNGGLKQQIEA